MSLVIATGGHVWIARNVMYDGHFYHCTNARIVREWGTTKGLNELVDGPTARTIIDAPADVVTIVAPAMIAIIPCREANWLTHL